MAGLDHSVVDGLGLLENNGFQKLSSQNGWFRGDF